MRLRFVGSVFACTVLWTSACGGGGSAPGSDGSYGVGGASAGGAASGGASGGASGDGAGGVTSGGASGAQSGGAGGGGGTSATDAAPPNPVDAAVAGFDVWPPPHGREGDLCQCSAGGCYDGGCKSWVGTMCTVTCYDSDGLECDHVTGRCIPLIPAPPPSGNICDRYQPTYLDTHHSVPQVPVAPASPSAKTVSTGETFSCAVMSDGTVKCWGDNSKGQLGLGVSYDQPPRYIPPTVVPGLGKAVAISAYDNHACAVLADGHVACWGTWLASHATYATALGPALVTGLENIVAVDVNRYQACAVDAAGQVWCWGFLGYDGLENTQSKHPMPAEPSKIPGVSSAIAVSLRELSNPEQGMACALLSSGQVQCWGQGYLGQKGFVPSSTGTAGSATPIAVANVSDAVAVRGTCVLRRTGQVLCWGELDQYDSSTHQALIAEEPIEMAGLDGAVDLAQSGLHVCVLKAVGHARCQALSQYQDAGALGDGYNYGTVKTPVDVCDVSNGVAIFAGAGSSCALLADGRLVCWGDNSKGQLGHGGLFEFDQPVVVEGL